MKTVVKLSLITILLLWTTFANGQLIDTTLYKVKLEEFKAKEHNGKIMTTLGAAAIIVGGIAALLGSKTVTKYYDGYSTTGPNVVLLDVGIGLGSAGVIAIIPGIINMSVGHKKVREYTIKLDDARSGAYFSPNQVGFKLAFKF